MSQSTANRIVPFETGLSVSALEPGAASQISNQNGSASR